MIVTFLIIFAIVSLFGIQLMIKRTKTLRKCLNEESDRYFKLESKLDKVQRGTVFYHHKADLLLTLTDCSEIGDL